VQTKVGTTKTIKYIGSKIRRLEPITYKDDQYLPYYTRTYFFYLVDKVPGTKYLR
jgi:hypothetical protein